MVIVNYADQTAEATGVAVVANHLAARFPHERILILYPVKQVGALISAALTNLNRDHVFAGKNSAKPGKATGTDSPKPWHAFSATRPTVWPPQRLSSWSLRNHTGMRCLPS